MNVNGIKARRNKFQLIVAKFLHRTPSSPSASNEARTQIGQSQGPLLVDSLAEQGHQSHRIPRK